MIYQKGGEFCFDKYAKKIITHFYFLIDFYYSNAFIQENKLEREIYSNSNNNRMS